MPMNPEDVHGDDFKWLAPDDIGDLVGYLSDRELSGTASNLVDERWAVLLDLRLGDLVPERQ